MDIHFNLISEKETRHFEYILITHCLFEQYFEVQGDFCVQVIESKSCFQCTSYYVCIKCLTHILPLHVLSSF